MKISPLPSTLLGRTAMALAVAFLLFAIVAVSLLHYSLIKPHTKQAADDLASFLVLVAQIWVELPPDTRADYEKELLERHSIKVIASEAPHPTDSDPSPYLEYLTSALSRHIGEPVLIHAHPNHPEWLWADFPMGGRVMRLGFKADRVRNSLHVILPLLATIALFIAFVVSVVLVGRITRPLAKMAEATHRIGEGDFTVSLPESGPREIANLAQRLNQMESQIRQLVENRTTLLAGISHDLRTPLARMQVELELLHTADDQALVDGLRQDIDEMEHLIAQTLLLARGSGGEDPVATDVVALLNDVAGGYSLRGGSITLDSSAVTSCVITLRANALRRVIGNLIENAIAYGEGKPVAIVCTQAGGNLQVQILDQGPGIPASERDAIFQPFHRVEGSRNRRTGGSGLGLAIVQQLCDSNGWRVTHRNRAQGGSEFTVHLAR
ncbi:ATP-binding protein [Thiosocius teredinicola]|uniref:ATP-binding protein n=1 Tax=Thiosocius teredinicola TaxID=1973002 RepID=UPI000F79B62F